jgi:S-adenosylmethionine:tRNA ribosyltransferase-isomerase
VGPGTFRPLAPGDLARGELHAEAFALPEATAEAVARTRARGGRVVAVGTTATRVLESRALPDRAVEPGRGETRLFLRPDPARPDEPRPFAVVDALLTNFHLPRSSLLLLVAAFAGRRAVLDAYAEAIREGYRFYSYGDAMLIT